MERIDERLLPDPAAGARSRRRFELGFARTASELREAQRLRWRVFADEMGAGLPSREPGIDADLFDAHCEHLLVRDLASHEIVGTYRLLAPERARRIGGYYAESEFDLARLQSLRPHLVEVGRSCIHPQFRGGAVIALLWSGLARYMVANGYGYLAGCASMSMADGGQGAAAAYRRLCATHRAPVEYRVFPRCRLPLEKLGGSSRAELPPLLKGYLRCGAYVCGDPAPGTPTSKPRTCSCCCRWLASKRATRATF